MLKPFHNRSKIIKVIDGVHIPPGEVRSIPAHLHPVQTTTPEINSNQTLVDLLEKSVKDISAKLSDLTNVDLEKIHGLESLAENPRSTLLEAIQREAMARAEDPKDEEYKRLKELTESLQGKTAEELEALRLAEIEGSDDAATMAVIDAAIELVKAGE
jgi:hypothetical protein